MRTGISCSLLVFQIQQAASDQVFETFSHLGHKKSLPALRAAASTGNIARVDELAEVFVRDVKKLLEVSKVARNLSGSEPIAITAEKVEENIQTLCPHVSKLLMLLDSKG